MSRWTKQFPYLYMSKEELQATPNDTLKKLVDKFWCCKDFANKTDCWQKQAIRLHSEMLQRQLEGTMEPPASWKIHNKEVYDAWYAKH